MSLSAIGLVDFRSHLDTSQIRRGNVNLEDSVQRATSIRSPSFQQRHLFHLCTWCRSGADDHYPRSSAIRDWCHRTCRHNDWAGSPSRWLRSPSRQLWCSCYGSACRQQHCGDRRLRHSRHGPQHWLDPSPAIDSRRSKCGRDGCWVFVWCASHRASAVI